MSIFMPSHGLLLVYAEPPSPSRLPSSSPPEYDDPDDDSDHEERHDFEAWHDTTHVPALLTLPRSGAHPLFLACTRWVAADGYTPTHLCLYDLASPSAVYDRTYLSLIGGRSALHRAYDDDADDDADTEGSDFASFSDSLSVDSGTDAQGHDSAALQAAGARRVLERMQRVDRRVYEPLTHICAPTLTAPPDTDSDGDGNAWPDEPGDGGGGPWHGRYMSVVEVEMRKSGEAEFNRWFDEEHLPLLVHVPGWVRSRRFCLREPLGVTGTGDGVSARRKAERDGDGDSTDSERGRAREARRTRRRRQRERREERPPKYLAVHEWTSLDVFRSGEFKRATSTPWRTHVLGEEKVLRYEIRVFRLVGNWIGYEESARFD